MFASTVKWLAVGSVLGILLPGCVAHAKYAESQDQLARTQEERDASTEQLKDAETALADAGEERQHLQETVDALTAEKAKLTAQLTRMTDDGSIAKVQGTTIFVSGDAYGYRAEGDVIFASGSDTITTEGKKILAGVATELKKNNDPIVVVGHTDSDPIVRTADKWPRGNMQLGAGRALSVYEYLVSQGIPETRLGIQSFGPYQPLATGNSAEAKKKNRRVEIMVKVSDTAPPTSTAAATGSH
ncbi:MAG TPA: OmpA family protein [Planctomycetota bacterium]|nr:OmpA family protein [Planctomycetota bacterium]